VHSPKRIKELRAEKGLTQESLALRTGLARSYITHIECGKKIPALSTLWVISECLGVEIRDLFELRGESQADPCVVIVKKEERRTLLRASVGYIYLGLAIQKKRKIIEPFLVRIFPGRKKSGKFVYKSEEFVFVLEGELMFAWNGKSALLKEGDSVYFEASVPHSIKAVGTKPALILSIHGKIPMESCSSMPILESDGLKQWGTRG